MIASMLIFSTPIKNVALYGNPFYPIKVQVAGIVLNHKLTPETYGKSNRPQKWLQSIFEINTPHWSADQWNWGEEKYLDRAGGFFGAYVVFNLLLLFSLTVREQLLNQKYADHKSRQAATALTTILLVSLIPANFPQSHELRYFMFWMITLVSFNLSLISSENLVKYHLQIKYLRLLFLLFFMVMYAKIGFFYLRPDFRSLEVYLEKVVNTDLLKQISPNQKNCIISKFGTGENTFVPVQHVFFYSSYFHPQIGSDYSIKISENMEECGKLKIIPHETK
jgi:hypothetical protein